MGQTPDPQGPPMQTRGALRRLPTPRSPLAENDQGYVYYPKCVPVSDITLGFFRSNARKRGTRIFNHSEQYPVSDRRRSQWPVPSRHCTEVRAFMAALAEKVEQFLPGLQTHHWVALHSEAGCQAQGAHADYDPFQAACPGVGVLFALEDDTAIYVWPGSHRLDWQEAGDPPTDRPPLAKHRVRLDRGDLLVFDGRLVHAGADYPHRSNVRLHCFASAPLQVPGQTWLLLKHAPYHVRRQVGIQ
jgi:hypothetical protein